MEPQPVEIDSFTVVGLTVRTTNADELAPARAAIPGLWGRFFGEKVSEQLGTSPEDGPVAVYWGYESDASGAYNVTVGMRVPVGTDELPTGLSSVRVAGGSYLAFRGTGAPHEAVPATWARVWGHFSKPTGFARTYTQDFERYDADAVIVHVAVAPVPR